jgi:hypothetical protein
VRTANKTTNPRPPFIDAPEKGQAFGQRAKQAMSELIFGKDVKLLPHTIDRYVRLVAQVFVGNQDAGLELLKQGLCWVYEKYVGRASPEIQNGYRAAQAVAQSEKTDLWQDAAPVSPWEWRKAGSRIQPVLESRLKPLEHLFFDVFNVSELTPTRHVTVLPRTLDLDDELFHQSQLVGVFCRRCCLQRSAVCFCRFLVPRLIALPKA